MAEKMSTIFKHNWLRSLGIVAGATVLILLITGVVAASNRDATSYESTYEAQDPPTRPLRLSVIGDSYSAGTANNTVEWPALLAKKRGWYVNNVAEAGTGYAATQQKFYSRARYALDTNPDVILVVGGREDRVYAPEAVQAEAAKLYDVLALHLPNAEIVVVGPIWDSTEPDPNVVTVNNAIRAAAEAAGLTYIDALDANWLRDSTQIQADGVSPTDIGMRTLADALNSVVPEIIPTEPKSFN